VCISPIVGQQPAIWELTDEDGLPSNTIYRMLQDQTGFIWIGTNYGICRFDGKTFENFPIPYFKDQEILQLKEDNWGRLWLSNLTGQMVSMKDQKFSIDTYFKKKQVVDFVFAEQSMWVIFKDNKQAATEYTFGLVEIQFDKGGNIIKHNEIEDRFPMLQIAHPASKDDKLFVIGNTEYNNRKNFVAQLSKSEGKLEVIKYIFNTRLLNIYSSDNKIVFLCTDKNQLLSIDSNGVETLIHIFEKEGDLNSYLIAEDHYFFLNKNGLFHKPQNAIDSSTAFHWFKGEACNSLLVDREGNYWISTNGHGIFVIPSLEILHYNKRWEQIPNDNIYSFFYDDKKQILLVGLDQGKVITIKDNNIISQKSLPSKGRVLDIGKGTDAYWCSTDEGIIRWNQKGVATKRCLLSGKTTLKLENKDILAGTGSGLMYFSHEEIQINKTLPEAKREQGTRDKRIYALHQAMDDRIWVGTQQGLFTYDKTLTPFVENSMQVSHSISSITESEDSTIWISTLDEGIFCIIGNRITQRFDTDNGLSSNTCKNLFIDQDQLWVGTNKGINIIDLKNSDIRHLNKYDGLPSNEITAIQIVDTTVWIGTSKGLVQLSKNYKQVKKAPPLIFISGLEIQEEQTKITDTLYLKHDQNNFEIELTGFAYRTRGDIQYKYMLKGMDQNWNQTSSTQIRYTNLEPGSYDFEVKAVNHNQVESQNPAKIHLIITKAWWETYLFKILVALFVIIGLSVIYIWTSIQKEKKQLEAQSFQKTVSDLQMQALQTQVNPHFIFNALSAIQNFQVSNDQEQAIDYLSQFAHLIRMIFEHSKEKVITLDEELDFLKLYLELEQLRFKDKVTIDIKIAPEIKANQELIKIPPLLIQPIVENAFKHGLFHKDYDGRLLVQFDKIENYLICTIEDNGVGREVAASKRLDLCKKYEPSGLKTSEKRLEIYNNQKNDLTNSLENYLTIVDLQDNNTNTTGTSVRLKIRI